ncbi:MAG TPA: serine/threonine-protein kinase, partial [Rubricoccaceae bacterium]
MTPLPPDRWPEIERLFSAAADRPADEVEALLAAADPAVGAEVRALLDADRAARDEPAGPPAGLAALLTDLTRLVGVGQDVFAAHGGEPVGGLSPGTRVGPWDVEDEVGWGGMGVVYRARRSDGLHRQAVALKVVKRGMDSAAVLRRFAQERALLAGLDHPGIARLLDGGTAPDGRPYFVMELVDGEPITHAADRLRLGVEARVRLFVQVCEAVAHAHRRLVVHRDIKPSNVLVAAAEPVVGETGGALQVKLLDFGVARLLDGADGPDGALTLTGDGPRPMTPEYAAPEQLDGGPVTTATDVYALGVLLYELLTGHRPHQAAGRPPAALAGAIREAPPARPSTAAGQTLRRRSAGAETRTVEPGEVAASRGSTPDLLQRRLRGDLDAVVLKALRPEPEQRYASADALADDVRRAVAGLPVHARRGTARYRTAAFVRRHRAGVAAAT